MTNGVVPFLVAAIRSLAKRFDTSPVDTVEKLNTFVQTRSAFIAQTALHGYLKTRMGTKFRDFFEDEGFSAAIRIGSVKLYASSAGDFSIFAAASVAKDGGLRDEETAALAVECFEWSLEHGMGADDQAHVPANARSDFVARARGAHWPNAVIGESAFKDSIDALLRYAPVVDEFKKLDRTIVTNSMRFRWLEQRERLQRRLDAAAVSADWRAVRPGATGPDGDRHDP